MQAGALLLFGRQFLASDAEMEAAMGAGEFSFGPLLLFAVIAWFTSLWIAVGWHRYVLRVEEPGVVPAFHGDRILAYFGMGLLAALVVIPIGIVAGLIAGPLLGAALEGGAGPNIIAEMAFRVLITAPAMIVFYRFSPVLPAAALGEPLGFGGAWSRTSGATGAIVVVTLVSVIATTAIDYVGQSLFGTLTVAAMAWSVVVYWVYLMVGISILTTLYGHYVEGRQLV